MNARAATTTRYTHKECGSVTRWGADGLECLGAGCGATGLKVPDCNPVVISLAPELPASSDPDQVPLFGLAEIPGREAGQ
jgi:hypothetical protein